MNAQYRERVRVQALRWAMGQAQHNKVDDECCPDFSCCVPSLFEQDAAKRWDYYRRRYGTANSEDFAERSLNVRRILRSKMFPASFPSSQYPAVPLAPSAPQGHSSHHEQLEDVLDPAFFCNCPIGDMGLRPGDVIAIHHANNTFFAEPYIRQVQQANVRSGAKAGVTVTILRHHKFDPLPPITRPIDFEIRFLGPGLQWCVLRRSDQRIMSENIADRDSALKQATGLQAARI